MLSKLRNIASHGSRLSTARRILAITQNGIDDGKRFVSSAKFQTPQSEQSYQMYFTHNPVEGYIRNSPFDMVVPPNLSLDQYVWQNISKWQNHVAMVSRIQISKRSILNQINRKICRKY